MSDTSNHAASSGILATGDMSTLRDRFDWLRMYYEYKGLEFKNLRKDVLNHYSYLVGDASFRELLDLYAWRTWQWHCQEYCGIVNDNVWGGEPCTIEKWVDAPFIDGATLNYPSMKWHPMAKFKGWRTPRMGMIFDKNLRDYMNRI